MQGLHRAQSVYQGLSTLEVMFQKTAQNYSYRLLQLEMTIDEPNISIGRTKKEDISELIQLYMIGVEVLESSGDPRFGYFRVKLHDLMLKKSVIKELKFVPPEEVLQREKQVREQKRKEYQTLLVKSEEQETQQAQSIVSNATSTVEQYKDLVESTLKKQQNQIRERLNSRKKRPDSATSLTKPNTMTPKVKKEDPTQPSGEYYSPPPLPKSRLPTNHFQLKPSFHESPKPSSPQRVSSKAAQSKTSFPNSESNNPLPIPKAKPTRHQDGI